MKKIFLFILIAVMGLLVACGSDSSTNSNGDEDTSVSAFFPTGYKSKDVVAWYATDVITKTESDRTISYIDAVYLFKDGTFVATESKKKVKSSKTTLSNGIAAIGTWTGGSDFSNGSFVINAGDMTFPVEIKKGSFTVEIEDGNTMIFKLMSSSVPKATEEGEEVIKNESSNKSSKPSCSYTSTSNSVNMKADYNKYSIDITWKIEGDSIHIISDEVYGDQSVSRDYSISKDGETIATLKEDAKESCEDFEENAAKYFDNDYDDDYDYDYDYHDSYDYDYDYDYDDDDYDYDDRYLGYTEECKVSVGSKSVTVTISVAEYTTSSIYTLTDTGYRISYKGYGADDIDPVDVPSSTTVTMADLKDMAEQICNNYNEAYTGY